MASFLWRRVKDSFLHPDVVKYDDYRGQQHHPAMENGFLRRFLDSSYPNILKYDDGRELLQRQVPLRTTIYYSRLHNILLVGEGDFSFSSALATEFEDASNILATSLDSRERVLRSYKSARYTIANLEDHGARVLHNIDATRLHQLSFLRARRFDRIVFNFPHAGFHGKEDDNKVINKHRNLVSMFFRSASVLLSRDGEIHLTHKDGGAYDKWNLVGEAQKYGLHLLNAVDFNVKDYPGYVNKRGDGDRIDETFLLGPCKTYIFTLTPLAYHEKESLLLRDYFASDILIMATKRRYAYEKDREEEEYRHVKRQRIGIYNSGPWEMNEIPSNTFTMPICGGFTMNGLRIMGSSFPRMSQEPWQLRHGKLSFHM